MKSASACTVVVTRSSEQAPELARRLAAAGFRVELCPAIGIRPRAADDEARRASAALAAGDYDWTVFTSPNGVSALQALVSGCGAALPEGVKTAVQGESTGNRLRSSFNRTADLTAPRAVAEALLSALLEASAPGERILLALASETRGVLEKGLSAAGRRVEVLRVYETMPLALDEKVLDRLERIDPAELIFTFFSPSAVRSTARSLQSRGDLLRRARCASIGPITSAALHALGIKVFVEAEEQSAAGMVRALQRGTLAVVG